MTETQTEHVNEVEDQTVEWSVLLVKRSNGTQIQKIAQYPEPSSADDLYKELVIIVRDLEAQHAAQVHAQAMVQAAMQAQGMRESGLITPKGVKTK